MYRLVYGSDLCPAPMQPVVSVQTLFLLLRLLHVVNLCPVRCRRVPRSPNPRRKRRNGHQNAGCQLPPGPGGLVHRIERPSWTSLAGRISTRSQDGLRFFTGFVDGAEGGRPRSQWKPSRPDPTPGARDSPQCPSVSCSSLHRAASGPTALFRNTKAAGAAIGGVKNMLLEWCRAMTRNYEVGTGWGYRRDKELFPRGNTVVENLKVQIPKGGRDRLSSPGLLKSSVLCPPISARGHPKLLLQLEQRHGLLCPHPQVFSRSL